jgi:hypothetical protein
MPHSTPEIFNRECMPKRIPAKNTKDEKPRMDAQKDSCQQCKSRNNREWTRIYANRGEVIQADVQFILIGGVAATSIKRTADGSAVAGR